jgi:hypothetical protein
MLALLFAAKGTAACPAHLPDKFAAVQVADNAVLNGLAMSITQLESADSVDRLLSRTEKLWADEGHKPRRGKVAGWQVLSVAGEGCITTLQLVSRDGAFGYFTRSRKANTAAITPQSMGIPIPADAKVASSVASNDDGRKGLVMAMNSSRSPEELSMFFMEQLTLNKWSGVQTHRITDRSNKVRSLFINARRDRAQIEIVIWPERSAQIVLSVSEAL